MASPTTTALRGLLRRRLVWISTTLSLLALVPGGIGLAVGHRTGWAVLYAGMLHIAVIVPGVVAMHLKNCLATPATRLVPYLGVGHVRAAAAVLVPIALATALIGAAAGLSPEAAAALACVLILLTFGGPWTLPYGLAVLGFLPLVGGTLFYLFSEDSGQGWALHLLERIQPWHVWGLAALAALLLVGLLRRAVDLHPERLEYRTRPYMDFNDPTRAACESPLERLVDHLLRGVGRNRVPTGQRVHGASAGTRLRHWRRGMSEYSPMISGLTMGLVTGLVGLALYRSESQQAVLTLYLFLFPAMRYLQIHRRRDQVELEALLPLDTEQRWREMDRAVAVDFTVQWVWYAGSVALLRLAGLWGGVTWPQLAASLALSAGVLALAAGLAPLFLRIRSHQAGYIVHMTLVTVAGLILWLAGRIWLGNGWHPGWLLLAGAPVVLGWLFHRWGRVDRRSRDLI
jgi:hypothetical protein